jgi:hypothetical protein
MRRLMLLVAALTVVGAGVWYVTRGGGPVNRTTRITSLLPADTLAFVHVPDFNRARKEWRETDVYKLWHEPAVQAFLEKPMARMSPRNGFEARLKELESLRVKDAFIAVAGSPNDQVKVLGGFHFDGSTQDAQRTIGSWRTQLRQNSPAVTLTPVEHRRHKIEVATSGGMTFASVYNRDWFFAANDVAQLTALLDRMDGVAATSAAVLSEEANFTAAFAKLPNAYAAAGYVRVNELLARSAATFPAGTAAQLEPLRRIRNVAAASRFENGKIRDSIFVSMPKAAEGGELTRSALALTTPETFLYIAGLLQLPSAPAPNATAAASPVGGRLQQLLAAIQASGVTAEEWNRAFGAEFGVIGDWPAGARLPGLLATLPVDDAGAADAVVMALTRSAPEGREWSATERNGVKLYSQAPANPFFAIAPTIALGHGRLVLGLEANAVAAAATRADASAAQLNTAPVFTAAQGLVPQPTSSFAYLDTALLYTRLDAALRPMLIMSAAFMPAVAQSVDLAKLPDPTVITRHLSPIVLSQSYSGDGYLVESVGPVSAFQAAFGIAAASGAGAMWYGGLGASPPGGSGAVPSQLGSPSLPSSSPSPSANP